MIMIDYYPENVNVKMCIINMMESRNSSLQISYCTQCCMQFL